MVTEIQKSPILIKIDLLERIFSGNVELYYQKSIPYEWETTNKSLLPQRGFKFLTIGQSWVSMVTEIQKSPILVESDLLERIFSRNVELYYQEIHSLWMKNNY